MVCFLNFYFLVIPSLLTFQATNAAPQQIDAVLLDELLRDIVDNSMSELRHRLEEAVFASAFRRRIQSATSSLAMDAASQISRPKDTSTSSSAVIDKFLDEYMRKSDSGAPNYEQQRKMSLALETYTTTTTTARTPTTKPEKVELITAENVGGEEDSTPTATGRMFDDADAMKEPVRSWQSQFRQLPRVPIWVAITVCTICVILFFLLIASIVFYLSQRRRKRQVQLVQRSMPDPLTVAGLCHPSDCMISHSSRRSSYIMDQDRGGGSIIWANS